MLNEDKPIEKIYYSIGEVAAMFNLTVSNIRFWETEFDILMPKKNAKGDRFFTKKDMENLKLIHYLLKEKGYTIEGAKKKLRDGGDAVKSKVEAIKSLEKIKSFLQAMKDELDKKDEPELAKAQQAPISPELFSAHHDTESSIVFHLPESGEDKEF
jgi:DNA-binding transcriptional MerR regulator